MFVMAQFFDMSFKLNQTTMKKLLLIAFVSFTALAANAQGNGKNKQKKTTSDKVFKKDDKRYEKDRNDRNDRNDDDRYERDRRNRHTRDNDQILNGSDKYSKLSLIHI